MKKVSVVAFALLLSVAVFAGGSEKKALELLGVMDMEATLNATIDNMMDIQMQQNPQLAQFEDVMRAFFAKYFSYDSLKDDLAAIYADAFSKKELDDLIAFYKTETGKKTIKVLPELQQKGAMLGMERVTEHQAELQMMLMEAMQEQK